MRKTEKLLVISERGIGDALTLLPALIELKRCRPNVVVELVAPGLESLRDNLGDVAMILNSQVLPKEPAARKHWLEDQSYAWVWNTENEHSTWRPILQNSGNPNWISAPPHRQWPKKSVVDLRMQQLRTLFADLRRVGYPVLSLTSKQKQEREQFRSSLSGRKIIAIQPGGNDPNKVWDADRFLQVIARLTRHEAHFVVLFLGGSDWHDQEATLQDNPMVRVVRESLAQAVAKLAACELLIGNDSGFYHLAHGLGLKVVGIYRTRGSMKIWSYGSDRSEALSFYLPSSLRRHWRRFISVDQVVRRAEALLGS